MKDSMTSVLVAFADDVGKLLLRIALAVAIFPHGAQKVLGLFGGKGLDATWEYFTETLKIAPWLTVLAIFTEFFAPIFLVAGIFTRIAAILLAILFGVAASHHIEHGFFINWHGAQGGEGVEYHILLVGAVLAVAIFGGGKYSLSRLYSMLKSKPTEDSSDVE